MKRLAALAATATLLATSGAQAATTLKIACYLPPFSVSVSKILKPFANEVSKATGGSVKFQEFWGGSLGRNPEQQYKLVTGGVTDIVFISTYTAGGQFPDASITELPGLVRSSAVGSPAYWRFYKAGMMRGFDDIKTVGLYLPAISLIHSRQPIKTLDDAKGLKIQAAGPNLAEFIKQFGGVPVYMPATELAQSLTSGVIDGSTVDWTGFLTFKLQSLAKNHYEIPLGAISFVIAMNKGKWESLSKAEQAAIDKFGGERMADIGGKAYDAAGEERRQKVMKDKTQHFVDPSDAQIEQIMGKYAPPVYKNWIDKTPDGQKKFDTFKRLLAEVKAGK